MNPLFFGKGLGCWPLGGDQWGEQSDADSIEALKAAYEAGVTHFDTAQVYGKGHGEELIGQVFEKVRENVFIATKIMVGSREKTEKLVLESLGRLKTDYIDLLYLHWPKKNSDPARIMAILEQLRRKGVIRAIGVSNFTIADMEIMLQEGTINVCQLCYNLLWRREEKDKIPFCNLHTIAVACYSSLAEGILTGKFGLELNFPRNDHRNYTLLFSDKVWPKVHAAVEQLKLCATDAGLPLVQCALQWMRGRIGISSILLGARNALQVKQNFGFAENGVSEEVLQRMTEISNALDRSLPEDGCFFKGHSQ